MNTGPMQNLLALCSWTPGSLASHSRRYASAFCHTKNGGRRPPMPRGDDSVRPAPIDRIPEHSRVAPHFAAPCGLRVPLATAGARVLLDHRDCVAAGNPAMEVDVGAALRAERTEAVELWLATDRAALRRAGTRLIHGRDVGLAARKWKPALYGSGQPAPSVWSGARTLTT